VARKSKKNLKGSNPKTQVKKKEKNIFHAVKHLTHTFRMLPY